MPRSVPLHNISHLGPTVRSCKAYRFWKAALLFLALADSQGSVRSPGHGMVQAVPLEGITNWARPRKNHRQGHGAGAYFLRRILRILFVYHQLQLDSGLLICLLTAYVGVLAAGCRAGETPLFRPVLGWVPISC